MAGGCGCDGHSTGAISRRAALTAGSAVFGAGLLSTSTATSSAQVPQAPPPALPENALITLGVQAGPPPIPNRIGISSALKVGTTVYMIDCGLGSLNAFTNAGLKFANLKSMFITHLHTDHIVDYFSFFVSGGAASPPGRPPVQVYGPGPAGGLPPSEVGNPNPPTVDPAHPTPGLADTTRALQQAFAYTSNIFIRDNGIGSIENLIQVNEIAVPPGSDFRNRAPRMDPFPVMSDENITVSAILVPHYDVYPAFAFRFDIKNPAVSVTFSGDTTKSENVVTLARGTDILIHESMFSLDTAFYGGRFPPQLSGQLAHLGRAGRRDRRGRRTRSAHRQSLRPTRPPGCPVARRDPEELQREDHDRPRRPGLPAVAGHTRVVAGSPPNRCANHTGTTATNVSAAATTLITGA